MMEIPESYSVAEQLRQTIVGKTIAEVLPPSSPHSFTWYRGEPEEYDALLAGATITDVQGFGAFAELEAGSLRLAIGDGATFRYYEAEEKLPTKYQLHVGFTDGSALRCTVQMYGGIWAFPVDAFNNDFYRGAKHAISPLSDAFTLEYFTSLLNAKTTKLSTKAFLATEQRIPGLGNGVLQDILWRARLHPKRKMNTLSDSDVHNLFDVLKQTLAEMAAAGGRDTERDIFGNYGCFRTVMSRNNKAGICPVCGDSIIRFAYLGGNVYVCETCQPLN